MQVVYREKRQVSLPTIRLRSNEEIKAIEEEAEDTAALSDIRRRKRRARRRHQDARTLRDPFQLNDLNLAVFRENPFTRFHKN